MPVDVEGSLQFVIDPLGHLVDFGEIGEVFDQNREFVTAEPGHGIAEAEAGFEAPGDGAQQLVAREVGRGYR